MLADRVSLARLSISFSDANQSAIFDGYSAKRPRECKEHTVVCVACLVVRSLSSVNNTLQSAYCHSRGGTAPRTESVSRAFKRGVARRPARRNLGQRPVLAPIVYLNRHSSSPPPARLTERRFISVTGGVDRSP